MRRKSQFLWIIPLVALLAGCGNSQGGASKPRPQAGGVSVTATPLDTAVIQTQTLAPAPFGDGTVAGVPAAGRLIGAGNVPSIPATPTTNASDLTLPAQSAADIGAAAAAALQAGAKASTAAATDAATQPTAETPSTAPNASELGAALGTDLGAAPPKQPSSPEEAACVNDGGRWGPVGNGSAMSCFRPMRDAGKSCAKESDCASQCLARSRSCAPFWPIFGCTEVIQNNGAVVNLCLN